jgi:hypothetical protein
MYMSHICKPPNVPVWIIPFYRTELQQDYDFLKVMQYIYLVLFDYKQINVRKTIFSIKVYVTLLDYLKLLRSPS